MDDSADHKSHPLPLSNPRRRNSISTPLVVPANLTLSTTPPITKPLYSTSFPNQNGTVSPTPPPPLDFELVSLKTSLAYTSLRDLIPSSPGGLIHSPTAASAVNSGYEISIRNRLVKQAAWAYLQPMSSSPVSVGTHFFHRFSLRLSAQNPVSACLGFIRSHVIPTLTRAFDGILRVFRVRATR
ncbi:uncharacterized protein LOC107432265 isoform X2 [Ziziphus jujuba]|uniref:Uncharacterized protein LOC107432265 isoform X2 n=2 Tax=Ziziphus jujuba TaxID=326968 RepID=A0A6P6FK44_ZIZJJ|nr:uncharacterized protein LOC107432265 isoform X2 [Ziziphus jujuba]KAH7512228.1 hypothetical protein FEM48_Zijuj12G0068200 [Ziziphus jujuba var. spinosa]